MNILIREKRTLPNGKKVQLTHAQQDKLLEFLHEHYSDFWQLTEQDVVTEDIEITYNEEHKESEGE